MQLLQEFAIKGKSVPHILAGIVVYHNFSVHSFPNLGIQHVTKKLVAKTLGPVVQKQVKLTWG